MKAEKCGDKELKKKELLKYTKSYRKISFYDYELLIQFISNKSYLAQTNK